MAVIYYTEDDDSIRELVIYTLRNSGYEADGFITGAEMMSQMGKKKPDLILLDVMLPKEDGLSILKRIRQIDKYVNIPVMMITAKDSEYDKVRGLDEGADDYLTKPFGMMELVARVKALVRRIPQKGDQDEMISFNGVVLDTASHTVTSDGEPVQLSLKEYDTLKYLLKNKNKVVTRDILMNNIWGYEFDAETRTVDVHIRNLRSKLGTNGDIIQTVRGVGYKIGK